MNTDRVSIILAGVGGYGKFYVDTLLSDAASGRVRIVGAVDPLASKSPCLAALERAGVPFFESLRDFYGGQSAQLAILATPIHRHCPQTCEALENGSNVLCEKPLGATIQEARRMMEARDEARRFVAIGYQWSFSRSVQRLKNDIRGGRFGRPVLLKTIVLGPRTEKYYGRNDWAGAVKSPEGEWVLDSPVNNAMAHYLHNMFYVLGSGTDPAAMPAEVVAELYRVNPITNYDTGVIRCRTLGGVEVLFYTSHAVAEERGPEFTYTFEKARVVCAGWGEPIRALFHDGTVEDYGNPLDEPQRKVWNCVDAVLGRDSVACGPESASAQTLCMNGAQESAPDIAEFPRELVLERGDPGERLLYVEGLAEALARAYDSGKLLSDVSVPWAVRGEPVDLRGYTEFPRGSSRRV
ncbi:Gfo/Idh/MocA family protein [Verrucomicrobiota bacterium]